MTYLSRTVLIAAGALALAPRAHRPRSSATTRATAGT